MPKKFQKRQENFVCDNCKKAVTGTGFTNHCPVCLWSKHVDINPGDRLAQCQGLMEPIGLFMRGQEKFILHQCSKCEFKKPNKVSPTDNEDLVIKLSTISFDYKY